MKFSKLGLSIGLALGVSMGAQAADVEVLHYWTSGGEAKSVAESQGGKVLGSLSKKLNYLVVGNSKPTNSKIEKANKIGIEIIDEEKWYKLLNR